MARIYKESRYVLQLLIGKSYGAQYDDVKISFYTKNPNNQVMVDDGITIKRNIAEVMVDSTLFDNLEEGLIKYIVYGTKDGIPFIEERQSNYFLKTPLDFKPTTCILEDKSVTPSMADRDGNNLIVVEESEGYDGLSRVVIDPQTLYNEGVEAGRAECSGPTPAPPQDGWGMTGYFNSWGGTPDIPFEENGEWEGRPYKVIRNFEAVQGEFKIRRNNAWTNSYTADFYNEPQFAKLQKGDSNMPIDDGVWDIYLFFGDDGKPNEMLILHTGTDLSTIKYEYTLNVSVDKENAIIEIGDGFDDFSAKKYYGGSATIPMKYGCRYSINVFMEGYEDIFEEITCYNDEERNYTLTKAEGGGDCNLTSIEIAQNGFYYPESRQMETICFMADSPSAYNTGIKLVDNSWIEIYFSIADEAQDTRTLIGCGQGYYDDTAFLTRWSYNQLEVSIGRNGFTMPFSYDGKLHKLKFGKTVGVWFDDEKQVDIIEGEGWSPTDLTLYIGAMNDPSNNNENGFYKHWYGYIGDVTIYGSLNENVGEYHFKAGDYGRGGEFKRVEDDTIIPNLGGNGMASAQTQQYGEGSNGFSEVIVNVAPKINLQETGLKLGYSSFTEVPEWADFEGITNMGYMFSNCSNLQTIPLIDTSNVTGMSFMFVNCYKLQTIPLINTSNVKYMNNMFSFCIELQTIPLINTSNVTNMEDMFQNCSNLQTIPSIDTSNVTDMSHMFDNCSNLQTIPSIDTSNVTEMNYMFSFCQKLQTLPKFNCQKVTDMSRYFSKTSGGMSSLTDVGGWENLKCNWDDAFGLATCPNLTYQSCINVLNGLYDFVGNGSTETRTLRVHPNFLTTVGDEISIGTNKGWQITA